MYDELISALRNNADHYAFTGDNGLVCLLTNAADAIEDLISALTASNEVISKSKPKWIPVTERLPEQYVNVLVFLHSLDWNSIYYSIDHLMEDGQWWKASTSWKHEVTHWMPLSEPPKEE